MLAGAACTGSRDAPAPATLRVGVPEGLITGAGVGVRQLVEALSVEGLVKPTLQGRAEPLVAERWQWNESGRRLVVRLRNGVRLQDGAPLTARAVADSLQKAIAEPRRAIQYPSLADVTSVHAISDRDIAVDVRQHSALLPEELDLPIVGPNGQGTGPFRVTKAAGPGATLERHEFYHRGKSTFQTVNVVPFESLRTAWTSLLRGEVDAVTNVPPEAVSFVQSDDVRTITFLAPFQFILAFNSSKPPLNATRVRLALNLAVDRDALNRDLLGGSGEPATGPLWPQHWAYVPPAEPFHYAPQLAASMLTEAGHPLRASHAPSERPSRLTFQLLVPSGFALIERVALAVQRQLHLVGIDLRLEAVGAAEYNERLRTGRFDAAAIDIISGPTIGRGFQFWRSRKDFQGFNTFGYENAAADAAFRSLRESRNEAAYRTAVQHLQQALLADPPALFLVWTTRTRAVSQQFHVPASGGSDPLQTLWQWTPAAAAAGRQP